jgi:protein-L-isoaspartate(D-aspartate) O-methyltransferase
MIQEQGIGITIMNAKQDLINQWRSMYIDEPILKAFKSIPRENFVPISFKAFAYDDHPLPTLRNQSISQPTTVMMMLQALEIKAGDKVLEIGAGGGYQAALLSKIVGRKGKVVTVEVIPELVQIARQNIKDIKIKNVHIEEGDGSTGFAEEGPYDRIIITAACPTIPQPVIDQLKNGGVIIAPVGDLESQTMVKGIKENGTLDLEFLGPFRFVPMRGKYGFQEGD